MNEGLRKKSGSYQATAEEVAISFAIFDTFEQCYEAIDRKMNVASCLRFIRKVYFKDDNAHSPEEAAIRRWFVVGAPPTKDQLIGTISSIHLSELGITQSSIQQYIAGGDFETHSNALSALDRFKQNQDNLIESAKETIEASKKEIIELQEAVKTLEKFVKENSK